MDIKDFFDSTFSNITASCPDIETSFRDVLERAEKMKKNNDFIMETQTFEAPPEPKKASRRVLNAAAGAAAAVAVIGAGAFGVNYLNEHGALHEGGVESDTRAGYHAETTTAQEIPVTADEGGAAEQEDITAAPDVTGAPDTGNGNSSEPDEDITAAPEVTDNSEQESKDILGAVGDVLEFKDMTATIEQVDFDGTFLRLIYSVSGYEESGTDSSSAQMMFKTSPQGAGNDKLFSGNGSPYDIDTHRNIVYLGAVLNEGETVDLCLEYNSGQLGHYTLTGIDKSENTYTAYDLSDEVKMLIISPLGAVVASTENYLSDMRNLAFEIRYNDDSTRELVREFGGARGNNHGGKYFGLDNGLFVTHYYTRLPEPIDVQNISSVAVNGTEISLSGE